MVRRRSLVLAALSLAVAAGGFACVLVQDLGGTGDRAAGDAGDADGDRADAGDASVDAFRSDGSADATPADAGPTGPGPLGALPSGYCCTSDEECRFRKCVDTGGGMKMCLDACSASRPGMCARPGLTFTCQSMGAGSFCQPPPGFDCLDPATFVRGTATTGACCQDSADGLAGHECEANLCLAIGAGPWFCTRRCDGGADCPGDYRCVPVADRGECVPAAPPYTCQ